MPQPPHPLPSSYPPLDPPLTPTPSLARSDRAPMIYLAEGSGGEGIGSCRSTQGGSAPASRRASRHMGGIGGAAAGARDEARLVGPYEKLADS